MCWGARTFKSLPTGVGVGTKFSFGSACRGSPEGHTRDRGCPGAVDKTKGRGSNSWIPDSEACLRAALTDCVGFSLLREESLILTALAGIQASSEQSAVIFIHLFLIPPPVKQSER